MGTFIARRLLVTAGVFLVISAGIFALVNATPGDAIQLQINPLTVTAATPRLIAERKAQLGLNRPLPVQYLSWLGHVLQGRLGNSFLNNQPVTQILGERLGPTMELMGLGLVVALAIAIPLGILAASRRNTPIDYLATLCSMFSISVPSFFLAVICVYLFALRWRLLPTSGLSTPGVSSVSDHLRHLVLPVAILGLSQAGPLLRFVRSGMIGELSQDYIATAIAKGAGQARVLFRHAFRNSLIPLVSVVMMNLPFLLAGAVVLEDVFAWPGMGQLIVESVENSDYPVTIGFATISAALILLCSLLADLVYAVVDPRVRLQ